LNLQSLFDEVNKLFLSKLNEIKSSELINNSELFMIDDVFDLLRTQ